MERQSKEVITVETVINAPVDKVWKYFSMPEHIVNWNRASNDWFSPKAENDFREQGGFNYRMEAKDGSFGFDFVGHYVKIVQNEYIEYNIADGRNVKIQFAPENKKTKLTERFKAETLQSLDRQKTGWQTILDNFKKYTERY